MVSYEWDAESVDTFGDVQDHFVATLPEVLTYIPAKGMYKDVVLVRTIWCESDGVLDRSWAYVDNGVLPELFDDGNHVVPKRYHAELKRANS